MLSRDFTLIIDTTKCSDPRAIHFLRHGKGIRRLVIQCSAHGPIIGDANDETISIWAKRFTGLKEVGKSTTSRGSIYRV